MQSRFTGPQAAQLAGLPYATLAKLARSMAPPTLHRAGGSGTASLWNFTDIVALASFGVLRPTPQSLGRLRELYACWHGEEGKRLIQQAEDAACHRAERPTSVMV